MPSQPRRDSGHSGIHPTNGSNRTTTGSIGIIWYGIHSEDRYACWQCCTDGLPGFAGSETGQHRAIPKLSWGLLREGLRLVEQSEVEDASRLEALGSTVGVGMADMEQGRFTALESSESLKNHLVALTAKAIARAGVTVGQFSLPVRRSRILPRACNGPRGRSVRHRLKSMPRHCFWRSKR